MGPLSLFTPRAGWVALGLRLQMWGVWKVIHQQLHIKQKVREHEPLDKLLDCFINMLASGSGLVEINLPVRPDVAVQRAFGRPRCAEQSTISDTLNACTTDNVRYYSAASRLARRRFADTA